MSVESFRKLNIDAKVRVVSGNLRRPPAVSAAA